MRQIPCIIAFIAATQPLGACRPAVDAPDSIEEMVVFAFARFEEEPALQAVVAPVHAWADEHEEQAREGWAVDQLSADDLATARVDDVDLDGLIGALGLADYTSGLRDVLDGITSPDKAAIYERTESSVVTSESGDRACFLDGDCETYAFEVEEVTKMPVIGRSKRTVRSELRWVDAEGEPFVVMRQVSPDPVAFYADVPLMAIDQQYGLVVLRPVAGGGVRRVEAFWVEARVIGADLPEGFAVHITVGQFQKAASDIDAWVDAGKP